MAQEQAVPQSSPVVGQKRGPGRPRKDSLPPIKKRRTSISEATPVAAPAKPVVVDPPALVPRSTKLPSRIHDSRPLPTLPQPQAPSLPESDYQSIAASAVLAASLERSRQAWTQSGIFERYWQKPETGKNARPVPLSNPDPKLMKPRGKCRLRIEPHIFEVEVWVVEKPKPPAQKIYTPPATSAYGQPYRQQQAVAPQYQQNTTLPPIRHSNGSSVDGQASTNDRTLPPITQPAASKSAQTAPPTKNGPDPVISMLATRASSDPELKALMKEVATGKATPDQLKIFQRHIDELTAVIAQRKAAEEAEAARAARKEKERLEREKQQQQAQIQYDGAGDTGPGYQTPSAYPPAQQQWQQPPPPPPGEVVFAFTTPGASEDRFLFPQNSILEFLSAQHCLASFIVTRKGRDSPESAHLHPNTEYWQPVTLMVEVAYGREQILKDVTRWVSQPDDVRKHMEGIISRCTRAPETHLALRLPVKGSKEAESEDVSRVETPVPMEAAPKPPVKSAMKPPAPKKKESTISKAASQPPSAGSKRSSLSSDSVKLPDTDGKASVIEKTAGIDKAQTDGVAAEPETAETGRPKRSVRKSVRISEG